MNVSESNILPSAPMPAEKVRLVSIARVFAEDGWRVDNQRGLPSHVFLWFTKGQGRMTIDGLTRGYGPNTLIYVPAFKVHACKITRGSMGYALFVPAALDPDMSALAAQIKVLSIFDQGQITGYFEQMSRETAASAPGTLRAILSYVSLLAVWIERHLDANELREDADKSASARLVGRYIAMVETDFASGTTVGDYASKLSVTTTHLTRVCRAQTGKSATKLLHDRIVYAARVRLETTDIRINNLAESLGFSSATYFSRLFSSHTGQSPRAFRNAGSQSKGRHAGVLTGVQ